MLKRLLCLLLVGALLNATPALAKSKVEKQAAFAAKAKAGIATLGTGVETRIEVRLHDKTKLKGYLNEVSADYFVVTEAATGEATRVSYAEVAQVRGRNHLTGKSLALGLAIGAVVALLVTWLIVASSD
jgi:hypothetical protein